MPLSFFELPEILSKILANLDLKSTLALNRVNRGTRSAIASFWSEKLKHEFPHAHERLKGQANINWPVAFARTLEEEYAHPETLRKTGEYLFNERKSFFSSVKAGNLDAIKFGYRDETSKNPKTVKITFSLLMAYKDSNGVTLLTWARRLNHQHVLDYFYKQLVIPNYIKKGVVLNKLDKERRSLLHWALLCRQPIEVIKTLFEKNELVSTAKMRPRENSITEDAHQHTIHIACEAGHLPAVKFLLEKHPEWANLPNTLKDKPLLLAACHNHMDIVLYLAGRNVDLNQKGKKGYTALHYAAEQGHTLLFQTLLEKNARVDVITHWPARRHVIHLACAAGNTGIVKILLEKHPEQRHKTDARGCTPFHCAIEGGHFTLAQTLLREQEEPSSILNREKAEARNLRITALHVACRKGLVEMARILLKMEPNLAKVKVRFYSTRSGSLGRVRSQGDEFEVSMATELPASQIYPDECAGLSALQIATRWNRGSIVQLLSERPALINDQSGSDRIPMGLTMAAIENSPPSLLPNRLIAGQTSDDSRKKQLAVLTNFARKRSIYEQDRPIHPPMLDTSMQSIVEEPASKRIRI